LAKDFSVQAVAEMADGYSGSDLHNLCVAAAYRPIRDFLAEEKKCAAASTPAPARARGKDAAVPSSPGEGTPLSSTGPGAPAGDNPVTGDSSRASAVDMLEQGPRQTADGEVGKEKASASQAELEGVKRGAEAGPGAWVTTSGRGTDGVPESNGSGLPEEGRVADGSSDGPGSADVGEQPMDVEEKDSGAPAKGGQTGGAHCFVNHFGDFLVGLA
jgi:hypothetical protein